MTPPIGEVVKKQRAGRSAVVREKLVQYSISNMGGLLTAFQDFSASAATATSIMTDLRTRPVPASPRVDVEWIRHLEELADALDKGRSDVERLLEEASPLESLQDLAAQLSTLHARYVDCLRHWRAEGGRELTPPRLWQRVQDAEKALKKLYRDVCDCLEDRLDVEDFRAAKEEWEREGKQTIPWEKIKADLGL